MSAPVATIARTAQASKAESASAIVTTERLLPLRELTAAGYGSRDTLLRRIHDGEIPAVKVGNAYKVRESDLRFVAEPTGTASAPDELDDLAALAARMVSTWPRLTDERKRELGSLLAHA